MLPALMEVDPSRIEFALLGANSLSEEQTKFLKRSKQEVTEAIALVKQVKKHGGIAIHL